MRPTLTVFLSVSACALLACEARGGPEATAMEYQTLVAQGDGIKAYALLSARDTAAVGRDDFASDQPLALPGREVDSAVRMGAGGDTVAVMVYGRGPNLEGLLPAALGAAMAGESQQAIAEQIAASAKAAPLITTVDTVVMLREAGEWRVWTAAAERRVLDSLAEEVSETYLEAPLASRGGIAQRWLALAEELPPALTSRREAERMREMVTRAAVGDSLVVNVTARSSYFGGSLDGDIKNTSATRVRGAIIFVYQGDRSRMIESRGIPPGGRDEVYESFARRGPVDSTVIMDVELAGQSSGLLD